MRDIEVRLTDIRIETFKCIDHLALKMGDTTVLIGENDSGKTTVLEAFRVALGDRRPSTDDFRVSPDGEILDSFVIDIRVEPLTGTEFSEEVNNFIGTGVQLPKVGPNFFTIRSRVIMGAKGEEMSLNRKFVKGWADDRVQANALEELGNPRVTREVMDLLSCYYLDAKRDIVQELRSKSTFWGRLTADLEIAPDEVQAIEQELLELSTRIVGSSTVLGEAASELKQLVSAMPRNNAELEIVPVPSDIDALVRSMDIILKGPGTAALPLSRHGMGTRTLSALMIFGAFISIREARKPGLRPLPVTAVEEPESHLHPQAQGSVYALLKAMPGQTIVSTHSPKVASHADVKDYRVLRRAGNNVEASFVPDGAFDTQALINVRRYVLLHRGELLFARVVILCEGDTETAALPVFARGHWGREAETMGVSWVGADGAGSYKHIVPLLEHLGIKWFVLSDGDGAGQSGIATLGDTLGRTMDGTSQEITILEHQGTGLDFEAYLLAEGYRKELESALASTLGSGYLPNFKKTREGQKYPKKKGGGLRDYTNPGWEERLVHDALDEEKGIIGAAIAEAILKKDGSGRHLPTKIKDLFTRIDTVLKAYP